jgi:mono/diheme cytochrome c family protein
MSPERLALALAAVVAAAGCSRDWRTDMWYQPSLRAEDAPRPEPEGSVPLDAAPRPADRDDAQELRDPVPPTAQSLARGGALFHARCAPCHGDEGHGGGPVSRYFPAAPDLASPTVRARSDGYIFGTITFGGRAMPSQREGLTEHDRWDLVNHVRSIQGRSAAP